MPTSACYNTFFRVDVGIDPYIFYYMYAHNIASNPMFISIFPDLYLLSNSISSPNIFLNSIKLKYSDMSDNADKKRLAKLSIITRNRLINKYKDNLELLKKALEGENENS